MANERQCCRLCTYCKIKDKFFGGKKYTCSAKNREVRELDVCSEFVRDGDKVLQQAGFRPHTRGSLDGCDTCEYCRGVKESPGITGKMVYTCKQNNVQFWPDFSPEKYICRNFKDGGFDALVGHLAELIK